MQDSLVYWLKGAYKATGVAMDAADGNAATVMQAEMARLTQRWQRVFNKYADSLSKRLATRILSGTDKALESSLKGQGFAVKFTMTDEMRTAFNATVNENVGLIRSIASQHLGDVQGMVMRSVAAGRDVGGLAKALQARYGITKRRAALIARDQSNKATSVMTAARQKAIGVTHGIWRHSHAGKVPRPSHVKANGERFELAKGMYLDGVWVMPSELVNCRCTWQPILPGFDD